NDFLNYRRHQIDKNLEFFAQILFFPENFEKTLNCFLFYHDPPRKFAANAPLPSTSNNVARRRRQISYQLSIDAFLKTAKSTSVSFVFIYDAIFDESAFIFLLFTNRASKKKRKISEYFENEDFSHQEKLCKV
uniref:Maturase K n=1 Tax=Romanomermis culicivorax TaxID=13658 RepID=A0A915HF07_ROMCU